MTQQDVHLVIASGGTGGHFFPALAVAREARAQAWRVTLVVAGQHAAEHLALAKQLELPAFRTPAVRLPHSAREWISFCPRFAASVLSARRQLKQLEPDLVLGLGSFAAAPVCLASGLMRIPLALHEANAKVGRANRVLARWARVLASSLPLAPGQSCRCPCVQTGLPLRDDLIQAARNETPASDFYSRSGLSADLPTLLVFGGSQGAEALNRLMPRTVAALEAEALRFQVIHLTGRDDNAALTDAYAAARVAACVRQAESHIENCYLAADLVVCRAGAASISELALFGKPAVLTYHCDLKLPPGAFNRMVNRVVHVMNRLAGRLAHQVVTYTSDFAEHSPFLRVFRDKLEIVPPPVELPEVGPGAVAAFARMHNLDGCEPVIGMAARLAAEKGVDVMLKALSSVLEVYPKARVLFAGQYRNVMGEAAYARELAPLLEKHKEHWEFLGVLNPLQMSAFYSNVDVIVVPSLNSTEAFGLVQVEAMLAGKPAIASDLPGVRQPVLQTGMGAVVPVGDSAALAKAIVDVTESKARYVVPVEEIRSRWNSDRTAAGYERIFERLLAASGRE